MLFRYSLFVVWLLAFVTQIATQDRAEKLPPSIQTTGEATVIAQPNQARIDLGVVTQASSSQEAAEQNARKLEATLTRLRQAIRSSGEVKTISYTIQPNYRYPKEGGEPQIAGYTATNLVRITLNDLNRVGNVIDTATEAGANRVQNLRFDLKNDGPIQAEALREAAANARNKAEALASALGLRIVRILSVVESGPVNVPVRNVAFARADSTTTPIEPGTIEVHATVTIMVEVSQ